MHNCVWITKEPLHISLHKHSVKVFQFSIQCSDTVLWVTGKTSGL